MRTFIGIPLEQTFSADLFRSIEKLRKRYTDVKWVNAENFHITLVFLGELSCDDVENFHAALQKTECFGASYVVSIDRVETFPSTSRPKVVHVPIRVGADMCTTIHDAVRNVADRFISGAPRLYKPHITLARIKRAPPRSFINDLGSICLDAQSRIDRFSLFRSDLTPSGARYREIHTYLLK